ncbi:T0102705 isoform 2 [Pongo abelii]|uniref:T0102705 isoform 2 n=1 Tax=Pongo abelii TaxID=9601 RepID=A0A2J8U7G8_PONAB|nr:T0102705 isoform 2 [Pongo abelii]
MKEEQQKCNVYGRFCNSQECILPEGQPNFWERQSLLHINCCGVYQGNWELKSQQDGILCWTTLSLF